MIILEHLSPSELVEQLHVLQLPTGTRVTVMVEDQKQAVPLSQDKTTVITAMNRLKGSGNGKLMTALLQARQAERPSK
jgi:hypothetical protein